MDGREDVREALALFFGGVPADGYDFIVFFDAVERHRHVVVCGHDFGEVFAEPLLKQFRVLREQSVKHIVHGRHGIAPFLHCD